MEIKIGTGLDKLIFGMVQNDVESILSKPDKINDIDTESDNAIIYYYYDLIFIHLCQNFYFSTS